MKHNLLPLFGMAFVAASANAQSWTAPTIGADKYLSKYIESTTAVGDTTYQYLLNVEKGEFLIGGSAWGTHAALDSTGVKAIRYAVIKTDKGVQLYSPDSKNNKLLFRDNLADCYIDLGTQNRGQYWAIADQGNGKFRLSTDPADAEFGTGGKQVTAEGKENLYLLGWDPSALDSGNGVTEGMGFNQAVYMLDPATEGAGFDWAFISIEDYQEYLAARGLYNALVAAEAAGYDIDLAPYATIYEGGTATEEELKAATEELNEKVRLAKVYAVLDGASEDNPKDATSLLVNPDLSQGNQNGWTNSFVAGKTANNVQYQSATYTNAESGVTVSGFIEAWTPNQFGAAAKSLGIGEISQTLESLPAGKYKLGMDVIAVNQDNPAITTGVQLFAKGGDIDSYQEVKTGNGQPEHFDVEFFSTGGDVAMGLRTLETNTANWIGIDNMTLTYFGEVGDPLQESLKSLIAELETQYPYVSDLKAQQTIIDAFEAALEEAQNATEEFQAAADKLRQAASDLAAGITEYEGAWNKMQELKDVADEADLNGWDDLTDNLNAYYDELEGKYEAKELTTEEIAEITGKRNELIGEYISANAKAGDDVTILLQNPGFDADFSGWDVDENGATPAWGGMGITNTLEDGVQPSDLQSGNAEVFQSAFDISQTIQNMPVGLYTLSCQAFARDDNGNGIDAELYAVINGEEQTVKVKNLLSEGSPDQLFQDGTQDAWQTDRQNGPNSTWVPNGMNGANVYFAAGYYKNQFNILVMEKADIKVGIRDKSGADWVLFDDFKLVYQGNSVAAYTEPIQDLENQAQALVDDALITQEADDKLNEAITAGEDALGGTSTDDCIKALRQLEEAIAFANESTAGIEKLQEFYFDINENFVGVVESSDEELPELMSELEAYVGDGADQKFATNEAVDQAYKDLEEACVKYAQFDALGVASADEPADISDAIFSREGTDLAGEASTDHWTVEGTTAAVNGVVEIYNQLTPSFKQTVRGLAPGWYKLGVQGFYRGQGNTPNIPVNWEEADTCKNFVNIVAGEAHTKLASLKSDAAAYNALDPNADETLLTTPNTTAQANTAFENDLYHNYLLFEVKEGEEEVVIGLEKEGGVTNDWICWDNWTLEYYGTEKPAVDPTTAVDGIEEANAQRVEIYSVGGTKTGRLLKGVNIIKTIKADGSVETRKVLVR